jgi:integrase
MVAYRATRGALVARIVRLTKDFGLIYRRGRIWWYKFVFAGQRIRESSKSPSIDLARKAETKRRRELEEGYLGLRKRVPPRLLSVVARDWLELKQGTLRPKSYRIEQINLGHLLPALGKLLISDITPDNITAYQQARLRASAAPKTINLEIGTLRAILRKQRLWATLQPDITMLKTRDDVGKALSVEEEARLLKTCNASRSRSLPIAVVLALHTGMRLGEIRALRWQQVDFTRKAIVVGQSKTEAGSGRTIPLNARASRVLRAWGRKFPARDPLHCVFPSERYGIAGNTREPVAYAIEPSVPIGSWKEAWESAKDHASVVVRFHDLRHTACTRLLEGGVPLSVVAALLGWSAATLTRMAKRYSHISDKAQRQAVQVLARVGTKVGTPKTPRRGSSL